MDEEPLYFIRCPASATPVPRYHVIHGATASNCILEHVKGAVEIPWTVEVRAKCGSKASAEVVRSLLHQIEEAPSRSIGD